MRRILSCWPLLLFVGLPFFFLGGPSFRSARSYSQLWNLGHILYFALLTLWLQRLPALRRDTLPAGHRLALLFLCPLLIGIVIECLQFLSNGRTPSIADICRNQLGVITALVFQRPLPWRTDFRPLSAFLRGGTLFLLLLALLPLGRALWDERQARRQFPLLADFESPFELDRWLYPRQLQQEKSIVRHGRRAARVQLSTARYSGIALFHFPGNWQGYRWLRCSVYNPLATPLELNCRIHDAAHRRHGNRYEDRFNTRFLLRPGWNDLEVSLQQVATAPKNRPMDMQAIEGFGLFVVEQEQPLSLFLDHVYLAP